MDTATAATAVLRAEDTRRDWIRGLVEDAPGWLTSMLVHMIGLLVMAMMVADSSTALLPPPIIVELKPEKTDPDEDFSSAPSFELPPTRFEGFGATLEAMPSEEPAPYAPPALPVAEDGQEVERIELATVGWDPRNGDMLTPPGGHGPGVGPPGIENRITKFTPPTPRNRAVAAALVWLAEHQMPDGGWTFNHALAPRCQGHCRNTGSMDQARVAATGLALLPFLGAGQTHQQGKFQSTVRKGLYFLVNRMKLGPNGGALDEPQGRMYSHGIAAMALCEAYAMTKDRGLRAPAEQALVFIAYAQDPVGGGWRYQPRQRGDTSLLGWQLMALKSGHMGRLAVPPLVHRRAIAYLDGVQYESGAAYGYTDPGGGSQATTAIGLLCRMHTGWNREHPALERGAERIEAAGPSPSNMYYNYYAAQVMLHQDNAAGKKWNDAMRRRLMDTQSKTGHETGSWFFAGGDHGATSGGRLYTTAMAAMTLEVDYRILPIYEPRSVEDDFPE